MSNVLSFMIIYGLYTIQIKNKTKNMFDESEKWTANVLSTLNFSSMEYLDSGRIIRQSLLKKKWL